MPNPDVAVPSLPRELNDMLSSELAQHVENYARAAVIADRAAGRASAEPEGFVPLTDAQIEKLREETFSTNNPFCPVDSKSMRKAVRAAERAHRLAAAPTPTASIAPKGEADGVCVKCGVYPSEPCPMPDPDECIQREDATPVAQAAAEASTHDLEIAERGVERLLDALLPSFEYVGIALRVSAEDHAAIRSAMAGARTSLQLIRNALATPVAQAAAGALSDEQCATQLALMKTPPMKDGAALHDWACDVMRAGYRLARPEADADRASGGGVDDGNPDNDLTRYERWHGI